MRRARDDLSHQIRDRTYVLEQGLDFRPYRSRILQKEDGNDNTGDSRVGEEWEDGNHMTRITKDGCVWQLFKPRWVHIRLWMGEKASSPAQFERLIERAFGVKKPRAGRLGRMIS
ncbi:hypothetical protein U1Q18_039675 [Sarracenia purpurea var. burkii]